MKKIGLVLLVVVGVAGGILAGIAVAQQATYEVEPDLRVEAAPRLAAVQQGGSPYEAIYTETQAISRALEIFPSGHNPDEEVGRLMTYESWMAFDIPGFSAPSSWTSSYSERPVWVVGILGDDLTWANIGGVAKPGGSTAMDGMYFVFAARSSELMAEGALSEDKRDDLADLSHESLVISEATPILVEGTPEPTWTPDPTYPTPTP